MAPPLCTHATAIPCRSAMFMLQCQSGIVQNTFVDSSSFHVLKTILAYHANVYNMQDLRYCMVHYLTDSHCISTTSLHSCHNQYRTIYFKIKNCFWKNILNCRATTPIQEDIFYNHRRRLETLPFYTHRVLKPRTLGVGFDLLS